MPEIAKPAAPGPETSWLQLLGPDEGEVLRLGLIEVRGYAGARLHDVLIVIDASDSTLLPSGWDVDGDGPAGVTDARLLAWLAKQRRLRAVYQRALESDLDDCVLMAEIAAVSALVDRLDPEQDRVGLLLFSDVALAIAPLGSDRARLLAALESVPQRLPRLLRGTHFAAAIDLATASLVTRGESRRGSIVLLSDGAPTLPVVFPGVREATLDAARQAAAFGYRIHAFALGSEAAAALELYRELSDLTAGRLERLDAPGDLIARLRQVVLTDLAHLGVRNLTTGRSAIALRVFPTGSFDAFVPLVPGENRIVVRGRLSSGSEASVSRRVVYRPEDSPQQRAELRKLMRELEARTAQIELWAEIERSRRVQRKVIELAPEHPTRTPATP